MLWEVEIRPAATEPDRTAQRIASEAADLGLIDGLQLASAYGYLIEGQVSAEDVARVAQELLADGLVEQPRITAVASVAEQGEANHKHASHQHDRHELASLVYVLPKPGVMDVVAQSALGAIHDFGLDVRAVRTFRKYWLPDLGGSLLERLSTRLLSNDAIEQVIHGPLKLSGLEVGSSYAFQKQSVELANQSDEQLVAISRAGQLSLSLAEMKTIQAHFAKLGRAPTDVELETIAQTWSEHCSHKTLKGRVNYRDEQQSRVFENLLKETVFEATQQIRKQLGKNDWCVSVFEDNAGVIHFDDAEHVVFKVETHNHPSALEPYGGANTGLGGVIRDPLGTGLGARPVCSTDVFCFAPPDTPADEIPPGVLHPRRVMKGVVAGVRDYGNRMGIPTVNGAIYFDPRYLGNPLVFCGNVGMLPVDRTTKKARAGDHVVVVGGRTGRDGIHGATFSSIELTAESETISGGAVQIGNAITEKMVLDVIIQARDQGLFSAITDCGAGGLSSAVGEMGEKIGAEVWLERVPLKYDGLSYTEIWISEAQERMVLAVPPEKWEAFESLCRSEGVEATVIGQFADTGRLELKYDGNQVADLEMHFLHDGRPPVVRDAIYQSQPPTALQLEDPVIRDWSQVLLKMLGALNVASKEWVIRQYDHEVQAGSIVKPLVGVACDGPSDAAVVRPRLQSQRGLVVSCGMNPHFGDFDAYAMAAGAIDEAVRNCVAVGADPSRIAILDNFCWGNTERPEVLGSLVRAALACLDVAVTLGTPFISGKDSLNNEFRYVDSSGQSRSVAIPPTLLISALGQMSDVAQAVTMDLKEPGNLLYQVGVTKEELAGSHFALTNGARGGQVPTVDAAHAKKLFAALHKAIASGTVRACHDLSEGGLLVAAAEMAFAGGCGAGISLADCLPITQSIGKIANVTSDTSRQITVLCSESHTRFLCEVPQAQAEKFEVALAGIPFAKIGRVTSDTRFRVSEESLANGALAKFESAPCLIDVPLNELKEAWQAPLRW